MEYTVKLYSAAGDESVPADSKEHGIRIAQNAMRRDSAYTAVHVVERDYYNGRTLIVWSA